ncbi:DUF3253 domain-containing protein [Pseudomonas huanghezhanensis]|uniref:DUF3253 domain-containing protein n=1 Tax=Pseudomonas huanghezhanensis TaxID=3002903 RepID=UPI002285E519|nr:DUF3253 domain-containing protein [Pseudomonas sp. BSw22131]
MSISDTDIEHCITTLLGTRDAASSICPSDPARALSGDEETWRGLMPRVREVARQMASRGVIRVTQGEHEVTINEQLRGPIRLRRGTEARHPRRT